MDFLHFGFKNDRVHVAVNLDRPLGGITQPAPNGPHIQIDGLSLVEAAEKLAGKTLDWAKIPRELRDALELGGKLVIGWEELQKHLK